MSISDALALRRGGPTAATEYLQRSLGTAIVDAMFPGIGPALRLFDSGVVNQMAQAATGMTFAGLQRHVAEEAAEASTRRSAARRRRSGPIPTRSTIRSSGGCSGAGLSRYSGRHSFESDPLT
jgi:hypothetical protein